MLPRFPKSCWSSHKAGLETFSIIKIINRKLRISLVSYSVLVAALALGAQASDEVPGAFVQTVSGARPIALSGAYVAIADDADAIWWNPAGISQLEGSSFTSTYADLYNVDGLSMSSLGFAKPTSIGAFGIGITYLRASDIPITDSNGNVIEHSAQSEDIFTLSYGNSLFSKLHLGTSIRYLHSGQFIGCSGFSLDLGLLANPVKRFYFGATLQRAASYLTVGSNGKPQNLSRDIKTVAAFNTGKLSVGFGLDNLLSSHYRGILAGCEISPCDHITFRTGLRAGMLNEANFSWTAGMGFNFKGMQVDYALVNQSLLASTHLISIGIFI